MQNNTMYSVIMAITPEKAKEWMADKNKNNRKLNAQRVEKYARDMLNGNWQLTPQGISFYENGDLCDGQHRLTAIIRSGVCVNMLVTYNVPNEISMVDRGYSRNTANILQMAGIDSNLSNKTIVGTVNFLARAAGCKFYSEMSMKSFVENNGDILIEAVSLSRAGSTTSIARKAGCIAGAFCALYEGINPDMLYSFFCIVNSGFYTMKEETAAIVLRNYLLKIRMGGGSPANHLFAQTTNAIKDFSSHVSRTRAYPMDAKPVFFTNVKKEIINT